jgi:hypothetical protein
VITRRRSNYTYSYAVLLAFYVVIFLLTYYVVTSSLNIKSNPGAIAQPSPITPSLPSTGTGLPTIQITSVQDGQQVPPGELTIQGVSSDTEDSDCQVFADVNDVTPMQNVTAAGESGDDEDFSTWTFAYTEDYQLISQGQNELTAKISCLDDGELDVNSLPSGPSGAISASAPLNEWHTVNVTGVVGAPPATLPSPSDGADGEDGADGIGGEGSDGDDGGVGGDGGDGEDEGDGGDGGNIDIPSLFS